ncbi:hypothetical protein G6F56_004613 [Rhizopus delemar]|uniref:Mitochondrial adapter protein MCP1 transmembrane domain-containing protein n=1 Tax=Rhizopus stolonifer TaxID=4846 RepID=A0A367KIX4_RHIST|nr:hypothetical protein G6F56_004613 [Rhizopus delemar]RCI02108.1 hypothetical protein CU098_010521 [Rhizopus stolonifer]
MSSVDQTPRTLSLTRAYNILTHVQSASAIVFSAYVVIHSTQILSANFGGVGLANRSLLLTRPFYQDKGMETVLVLGSAIVHVATGLAKFGLRVYWKQINTATHSSLLPYHRLIGHLQLPFIGLHYYLTRILPIQKYGDSSFIDFSYIGWGLQNRPIFTYGLHTTLVLGSVYHTVSGLSFIYSRYFKKSKLSEPKVPQHGKSVEQQQLNFKTKHNQQLKKALVAALSLSLISGLVIIGRDTKTIPLRLDFESMYSKILCN